MVCLCNKYVFRAFRQRDWMQQYANAKINIANVCKSFCKLLQVFGAFILFYFILHVREALQYIL